MRAICGTTLLLSFVLPAILLAPAARAVDFEPIQTLQSNVDFVTAIALGPENSDPASHSDGCIYALTGNTGVVRRICFDAFKSVISDAIVVDLNGPQAVSHALGITIDPRSSANDQVHLYVSYAVDGTAPFNGRIARAVSTDGGQTYTVNESFITGLPRAEDPVTNQTNGLDFGPDGCLYISQGSSSNSGYDRGFAESRLSGAVLRACFTDTAGDLQPGFDGNCGDADLQESCDVDVFASGFRNPYDIAWHSNGRLYGTDNDVSLGFGLDCGVEANNFGCPCQEPAVQPIGDELNLIEEGFYYGSPNPYRAMPAGLQCHGGLNAGDACTDDADCPDGTCEDLSGLCTDSICGDVAQCYYFGFGEDPQAGEDPNGVYRAPLAQISALLDGITEYQSRFAHRFPGTFCSEWDGQLLATGGPGPVQRFSLSADGQAAVHEGGVGIVGAEGLDIAVGPDGTVYLANFSGASVTYLEPIEQPDPTAPGYFLRDCTRAQLFKDDFDREQLGWRWNVDAQQFAVVADEIVENSGDRFRNAQTRWIGGVTQTPNQFGKLLVTSVATHSWGFMFRVGGPTGEHYEVHLPAGTTMWRWERYDPSYVERKGECIGDAVLAPGDYIGATIEGSGAATLVSVWRWDFDPDAGGPPDVAGNWGPPDCTMTGAAGPYVDDGPTTGLRSYTGSSTNAASADDWCGGDVGAAIGAAVPCLVDADCDDGNPCTDDICGAGALCDHTNQNNPCDDGDECTGDDMCAGGSCVGGPPDHCGDGVLQPACGEECDDAGESALCDADCTAAVCGDGVINTTAGEVCEDDADCPAAETCEACTCVPPPECGNGVVEAGEVCDEIGDSATCDGDCTLPACGDGWLNTSAGEICESASDCFVGEYCAADCTCIEFGAGQVYCDDFNRLDLGPNWFADNLSFSIVNNELVEDSGALFSPGQLRWTGGSTETLDQFGKIQLVDTTTDSFGFMFRVNGQPGAHYEVHLPSGTAAWRWERYDPFYQERKSQCVGDFVAASGDYIGATVAGTEVDTAVSVWRWDTDPDAGGPVNILENWGPPDCTMQAGAGPFVDIGTEIGVRAYGGTSTQNELADNWCGGDLVAVTVPIPACTVDADCDDGDVCNGQETCDPGGFCASGTPLVCDDGDVCTGIESCDPILGCQGAVALDCDDNNPCTDDSCDPLTGCAHVDNNVPCDDGLSCTVDDTCDGGTCTGVDDCPQGESCDSGIDACVPDPVGQMFSDDFDRADLGASWVVDSQSFQIIAGMLVENSGERFRNGQVRWVADSTDSPDQFGKLQITNVQTHSWGFMFRADGPTGEHYQVHLPAASAIWRWERYDPAYVERKADCFGDGPIAPGDYIGAMVQDSGAATTVSVWRWTTDPDAGGPVDIAANWGPPDCQMSGAAGPYVDDGLTVGIRSYTGMSTAAAAADNWSAGDTEAAAAP